MTQLNAHQQLSLDRGRHLRLESGGERLVLQTRWRRRLRRRRLALDAAFELLLRGRHNARHQSAPA